MTFREASQYAIKSESDISVNVSDINKQGRQRRGGGGGGGRNPPDFWKGGLNLHDF